MVIDILKHTIVNVCKSVTYGMKKPEVKFFRTCLESILEHRTTVLSNLGKSGRLNSKHVLKYFSRNLGKDSFSNIPKKVEKVLRKFVGELDINTCFCFDSVDLNKYSAKKMEGISKVRDGSTGDIINGYVINAVSVNSIPIIMEREELEEGDEGKTTRFDVFVNHVEKICLEF